MPWMLFLYENVVESGLVVRGYQSSLLIMHGRLWKEGGGRGVLCDRNGESPSLLL